MRLKDKLRRNSIKIFDYSKIKSQELKEKINFRIREKAILTTSTILFTGCVQLPPVPDAIKVSTYNNTAPVDLATLNHT